MANWTAAQKKAAARIFAQALPSLNNQKLLKPPLSVTNKYWDTIGSSSNNTSSSLSSNSSRNDLKTSESDEYSEEPGTTTDEVLFVLRIAICVLLMSCMF